MDRTGQYGGFKPGVVLLLFLVCGLNAFGQVFYPYAHYTSRQGLPQNTVRGLAFDEQGFLWIGTEGGVARFDGRAFRIFGSRDHPELHNQRITNLFPENDTSILLTDQLNGMYRLSPAGFTTLQRPAKDNLFIVPINGAPPGSDLLLHDTLLQEEIRRAKEIYCPDLILLPAGPQQSYVISDRVVRLDWKRGERHILQSHRTCEEQFALLDGQLLRFDEGGGLYRWQPATQSFRRCALVDAAGRPWSAAGSRLRTFNRYPFREVFFTEGNRLYQLLPTSSPGCFEVHTLLFDLPEKATVFNVAYRPKADLLALGTDTKGLFLYRRSYFRTFVHQLPEDGLTNAYYAQALLDSTTLLAGNGLTIDLPSLELKGRFPHPFHPWMLGKDDRGFLYAAQDNDLFRFDPGKASYDPGRLRSGLYPHSIVSDGSVVWIGSRTGLYRLEHDTLRPVLAGDFRERRQIKCVTRDTAGNIWLGTHLQLARLHRLTGQLDTFPMLHGADTRALACIRGRIFAGTYGKGWYVHHEGRFVRMPAGRNEALSNVHTFIEDPDGYLWITTNRGLYKTHLDAVDAYLRDTTLGLYYYGFQEEAGIRSAEFNGGCTPAHLWLPDGRLSLPSLDGLVFFDPLRTPHYLTEDSIIISRLEVDGQTLPPASGLLLPPDHYNIDIHFETAWWAHTDNLEIAYRLEGTREAFRLVEPGQSVCTFGHLRPGDYTLELRKRSGFGPSDYVYSRLFFTVQAPWYATPWAFALYAVAALLLIWGGTALNTRSIRRRNEALQRKVNEQTATLQVANTRLADNLLQLERSQHDLRRNLRMKDRLISILSHDVLTPLRFINLITRMGAEAAAADPAPARQALADVRSAVGKLFHSTQNILHWVKYQREDFQPAFTSCSPYALVEQLVEDFSEMNRFQGNRLVNAVPEDDVIRTDPNMLHIVLHNLLSNAIKFTRGGEIRIGSTVEGQWYRLEVSDAGRGMTAVQMEKARRILAGRESAERGASVLEEVSAGTGIGLSLIGELVRMLHGRCEIDSPGGGGVRVRVFLPVEAADRIEAP